MNTEELTPIVTAHQSAISRHDQEMAAIRATLQQVATQQVASAARQTTFEERQAAFEERHTAHIAHMEALQALTQEQLNQFLAGMIELRGLVADHTKGRAETP